jgi:hypothetical protein
MYWFEGAVVEVLATTVTEAISCLINIESVNPNTI